MSTLAVEQRVTELWETPKGVYGWFASVDHKELGIRYLITAFLFLIVGGLEALVMRIQLMHADETFLSPEMYNQLFSLHGITMIFWYASPILTGFSVYLVPLMAGARDIAYPRLNSFTYWSYLFSGILLYIGPLIGQGPHAGWFSYMPYTNIVYSPTHGIDFYAISLIFLGISTTGGAINFIITILRFRAPGMAISKMPLFLYSTLTISCTIIFAMPALTLACYLLIGANVFPVCAGLYFWLPKMTGRMMNERLGKWSFWVMFIGFNVGFFPMHIVGLMGMPRRIYTYSAGLGLQPMNEVMTYGAFVLGVGILLSIINFFYSLRKGKLAGNNPWNSDGLEWAMSSPPPAYEVLHIPRVSTRHPQWDDFDEDADPGDERVLSQARLTIRSSLLDAEPLAAASMANLTMVPMFLALALFGFFIALVFQLMWICLAGVIATFLLGCYWLWPRPIKGEL